MVETETHGFVNVFNTRNPIIVNTQTFGNESADGAAGNKPLSVFTDNRFFAERSTEFKGCFKGSRRCFIGCDHFDQLHNLGWKKPVRTDDPIRSFGNTGNGSDAQLRRIGGQNSIIRCQIVNLRENPTFKLKDFRNGFNNILSISQRQR